MHRRLPAGIALTCLLVAPLAATAADARPGVLPVVVPLSAESAQAAGVVRAGLVQALRGSRRHLLVHPVDAFDPEGPRERDAALREASAAMTAGRRAFETLEDGLGSADYARAEAAYAVAGPEAHASFVQARVLRLAVRWPEDPASVRRALPDLFSLAPDAQFPADMTPSDLAREAARAREALRTATKGTLDVGTTPVGAQLYVDGIARGATPVSLSDLSPGEHQLALFLPGYRWKHTSVSVGPNTRASFALEPTSQGRALLGLEERLSVVFDRSEECAAVREASGLPPANELLVAGVRRDGRRWTVTLQRFALPDAHVLGTQSLDLPADGPGRDPALQAAAAKLLASDRPRGPGGAPLGLRSSLSQALLSLADVRASSLRPWLGGAALALLAGGAAVGLAARSSETTLRATPQTDDRLASLQLDVHRRAVLSDGLTAAGLVAGSLWGWWRFGHRDEPALEPAVPGRPPAPPEEVPPLVLPDDPFASAVRPAPRVRWSLVAGPHGLGLSGAFR